MGLENQATYQVSNNIDLICGIVYEHEKLSGTFSKTYSSSQDEKPPTPPEPDRINNDIISIYLQSQFKIHKYLFFTTGLRQDFSSYYGNVTTPRLAMVSNFDKFTVKLLFNEAFRAPKPWDYTSGIGNKDLEPEKIRAGEFFFSYMISQYLNLETSLYRNVIRKKLVKGYLTADDWRWINRDKVQTNGAELGLMFSKGKLSSFANYTFNDSKDQDGNTIPEISEHSANAGITIAILPELKF
ncbi:MAG: TonB-dependent receptor, partial [Bacteroidales bacterium]|nr:TonB-dependent receptor [Bacteroidales bacterium]